MAKKLSFDAYLGWVNITNPNQIPEDARVISANDLLRYEKLGKDTAEKFAEVDKTVEGWKSDSIISDLIDADASETRYAVGNMVKTAVTDGVAKFQKVIDEVPAKVTAQVTKVIAEDPTVAAAAGSAAERAVEVELQDRGVVTGRTSIDFPSDFAWRHTTDAGDFLPLGYDKDLHLDEHARRIWREDINNTELITEHPTYAKVIVTESQDLLLGIRWDGGVDIPGLNAGGLSPTTPSAPLTFYNDMPYQPDSDIMPSYADAKTWAIWGSSSAGGIQGNLKFTAEGLGIGFYGGGQGGERSYHIAARLGSIPARLTFTGNLLPEAGEVVVKSSNIATPASLKTYAGYVVAKNGQRVFGQMARSTDQTQLLWTRADSGAALEVDADVEFVPTDGKKHRNSTTFLWMGKNNTFEPDRVIRETDRSFEYLAALNKRCMVLGHFVNTGTAASTTGREQIRKINDAHAARFGRAYFDVNGYLTSPQLWVDTKITPTAEDLGEQALGNKPPSVSSDSGHMNAAGYVAVRDQLLTRIKELGWITSTQGN